MTQYFWETMPGSERDFIEFLHSSGCFKLGEYVLKSGRKSPYFVDMQECFDTVTLPVVGRAYAEAMSELKPRSFDLVFGAAERGIGIVVALASHVPQQYGKVPVFWDRKVAKNYGINNRPSWVVGPYNQLVGMVRQRPEIRAVMVDDVITTGKAKKEAMHRLDEETSMIAQEQNTGTPKIRWLKMYIAVNRRETDSEGRNPIEVFENELGLPIAWVTDSYMIYAHLRNVGEIPPEEVRRFREYQSMHGLPEDRERVEQLGKLI